jgi:hypothetical protein
MEVLAKRKTDLKKEGVNQSEATQNRFIWMVTLTTLLTSDNASSPVFLCCDTV